MSSIVIRCTHCHKDNAYNKTSLSPYLNQSIGLRCRHCNESPKVAITLELLNGKPKVTIDSQPTDPTIGMQINVSNFKLATVHVLEGEHTRHQVLHLTEGDNIIGRKSDDDTAIKNKLRIETDDTKMSRTHCQITVQKRQDGTYRYILSDTESLNGTYYQTEDQERKIEKGEKIKVQPGDTIGLGYRSKIKIVV